MVESKENAAQTESVYLRTLQFLGKHPALAVTFLSFLGYFFAHSYQRGYLEAYGISSVLVEVELQSVVKTMVLIASGLLAASFPLVICVQHVSVVIQKQEHKKWLPWVIMAPLVASLTFSAWQYGAFTVIFLALVMGYMAFVLVEMVKERGPKRPLEYLPDLAIVLLFLWNAEGFVESYGKYAASSQNTHLVVDLVGEGQYILVQDRVDVFLCVKLNTDMSIAPGHIRMIVPSTVSGPMVFTKIRGLIGPR